MECWHLVPAMPILLMSSTETGGGKGLSSSESSAPVDSSWFWGELLSDAVMQWCSGAVVQWRRGAVMQCYSDAYVYTLSPFL